VTGAVSSRADLDAALARVRADLDPNVKNIVVQAAENSNVMAAGPAAASYSEMISSDDVRYAQTPDGVKHIYAIDTPASDGDAAANANAAGASGASGAALADANAAGHAGNTTAANTNAAANSKTAASNTQNTANASIVDNDTVTRSAASVVPLPNPATLPPAQPRGPSS
jgi:type III secretion protein D